MRMRWYVFLGTVCLSANAYSEPPSVDWTLKSSSPIKVGDPVFLEAFLPQSENTTSVYFLNLEKKPLPEWEPNKDQNLLENHTALEGASELRSTWIAMAKGETILESLLIVNQNGIPIARTNP